MPHKQKYKANIKSLRQSLKRRQYNRYYGKTMRNAIKKFKLLNNLEEAQQKLPALISLVDKNKKRGIIHANKAARIKSTLMKHVNSLQKQA
jgi:small subunit ribosomal protein S20